MTICKDTNALTHFRRSCTWFSALRDAKTCFWPLSIQMAANFRIVFKNWARYTLCQMDHFFQKVPNFSSIFLDREMWYLLIKRLLPALKGLPLGTTSSITLFSTEASLYRQGGLERGEKNGRGGRWAGEREAACFLFFNYCYFYWDTQRKPLRRREVLSNVVLSSKFVFFNTSRWLARTNFLKCIVNFLWSDW